MRLLSATVLLTLTAGCSSTPLAVHPLDGKTVVIEGRWNALAKEQGQILSMGEPKIIDVVEIGMRPVPKHGEMVRVTAVLHWRAMTEEEKMWAEKNAVQGVPDGYIIKWPEASWKVVDTRRPPNKSPEVTPDKRLPEAPSPSSGAPHL